ncbi:hypothetical protein Tco_1096029 [Tanacetum coccineum]
MCHVHGFEPTVGLFRCFYVNSKNKGWSFSKRQGNDAVCYTKPLDSLKGWNDHFFWVDAFACPVSFPWNTSKSVSNDPFPKSSKFNAEHYASLVAYPALFHKNPEPFLCLVGMSRHYTLDKNTYPEFLHDNDEEMDLLSFIRIADPTKVRIGERQRAKYEPKLLDTTIGRVVPLLQVAPAPAKRCWYLAISEAIETVVEDVAPLQPRHQKKRSTAVVDAGEPSHPAKRLRDDHGTPGGALVGGKSMSVVQRFLVGAVQNAEVRGEVVPTLPFVTSSVSATPEHEDSSHHSGTNVAEAEVDSIVRSSIPMMTVATTVTSTVDPATIVKEKFVESFLFGGGSSVAGGADHTICGFSDLIGSDFIVSDICTVISPDTDLQKVYVPQWSVSNGSRLDDGRVCHEMVDEFTPPNAEVRMHAEYNIKEKRRLKSVVDEQTELLKVREREIENFKEQLLFKEAEAAEAIHLRTEASKLEAIKKSLQDEMQALRKEKFYPYLLTTIAGRRWLLTHVMELAIAKCLNSPEYLSALGAAISKAIEKGMQDGLAARITHGKEGRVLTDVAAYNPSAEVDYISALQQLQNVNFSLLAELKLKDLSVETLTNILLLEKTLAERLGLNNRVRRIKDNIVNHISALRDVFIPLAEPFSTTVLMGMKETSRIVPGITTALSTTFASASLIPPIFTNDYEIVSADDQAVAGGNTNPFLNVDDAKLNI